MPIFVENARILFTRGDADPVARQESGTPAGGKPAGGLIAEEHPHKIIAVSDTKLDHKYFLELHFSLTEWCKSSRKTKISVKITFKLIFVTLTFAKALSVV